MQEYLFPQEIIKMELARLGIYLENIFIGIELVFGQVDEKLTLKNGDVQLPVVRLYTARTGKAQCRLKIVDDDGKLVGELDQLERTGKGRHDNSRIPFFKGKPDVER